MNSSKDFFARLMRFLTSRRWELLTKLRLNNLKINQMLQPATELELAELPIPITKLNLSSDLYNRLIQTPILKRYRKFSYVHSKPLEYLTTATLLDLTSGDAVLDAAGGSDAEYIQALMAFTNLNLKAYCQDALQQGQISNNVIYIGGSIQSIPLPDQSLDGISCHHSFEHFQQDLDIEFLREALRLLRVGGKLVITPLFLTNQYAEIWNRKPFETFDPERAITIFDSTASFAGWGAYEGFARTYSPAAFKARILDRLPENCEAQIFEVLVDGKSAPDMRRNHHQPLLNGQMKALVITKR
jgi:SAM-dependent methyltransferase